MTPLIWLLTGLGAALAAASHAQQAPPAQSLLSQAAQSVGVRQCLPAINRLSDLAVSGARAHDVLVDWDRSQPDTGAFFSLVGISFGTQSVAATITVIPDRSGQCTVAAERISVAPYTCQSIAQVELKDYRATSLLPTFTVYTRPSDPGASVSLIDSPPGCLVIRRHVQYGWRDAAGADTPATPPAGPRPAGPGGTQR